MLCCFFLLPTATCCVCWYFSGAKSCSSCNAAAAKRQKSNKGEVRERRKELKSVLVCLVPLCAAFICCRLHCPHYPWIPLYPVGSPSPYFLLPLYPFLPLSNSWLLTAASCPHINIWFDCLSVLRVSVALCVRLCVPLCVFQVCCQLLLLSLFRISFVLRGRQRFYYDWGLKIGKLYTKQ